MTTTLSVVYSQLNLIFSQILFLATGACLSLINVPIHCVTRLRLFNVILQDVHDFEDKLIVSGHQRDFQKLITKNLHTVKVINTITGTP